METPGRFAGTVMLALAVACSRGKPAEPAVQALVDRYAPGIQIGGRVTDAMKARYGLTVAPYTGFASESYAGPDGVRGLRLRIDEYVDDANPKVSSRARVIEVYLSLPDTLSLSAVRRRIDSALGASREACVMPGGMSTQYERVYSILWDRSVGVALLYNMKPTPDGRSLTYARGTLSLGANTAFPATWPPTASCSTTPER